MKKILLLFLSLCLFVPSIKAQSGGDDPIGIVIGEGGNHSGAPSHHAPALIPIQAAYYPSLITIFVIFLSDLGSVSVEIENETTGTYSQQVVNTSYSPQPFLITGAAGHWTITFTLANGKVYFGEFDINS